MGAKIAVVWFRNDLRLHDHQPLMEALHKFDSVIPVYCIESDWLKDTKYGTKKMGGFRAKFLLESLTDLKKNLQKKGADIIIKIGKAEDEIPQLCLQYNATSVYAFKEVAYEEIRISESLEVKLWKHKIPLNLFLGNTLYNKEDLPFPIKDIPDVFTNFRKRTERDSVVREEIETPQKISIPENVEKTVVPTLEELGFDSLQYKNSSSTIIGGESNALKRLNEYLWEKGLIKTYKESRNGLMGFDYSSKLSAWLTHGCISPRRIFWEVKKYERECIANDSTYWLIFELLWRDYFRFMFKKHGASLFQEEGIKKMKHTDIAKNEEELFELWKNSNTGIPFIDANMLELKRTGYMSNRGRQNVASFLINDLHVTWTKGAAWFEENLIDYNPASNWGNWAYLAGVGNDPREARKFNILKQANDYDPQGEYVKQWLPILQKVPKCFIHQPWKMTVEDQEKYEVSIGKDYPKPLIDVRYEM